LWALVIIMLVINLALMVLMCSLMNHVKFHVSTIWADLKQKLNMGGDENTRSGNSKYEPPQQVEQPKMTPVQLPQNPVKKPSSYRLPQKKRLPQRKRPQKKPPTYLPQRKPRAPAKKIPRIPQKKQMPAAPAPPRFAQPVKQQQEEESHWYYAADGDTIGSIKESQLKDAATLGKIDGNTLVWSDVHEGDWIELQDCPHLSWAGN